MGRLARLQALFENVINQNFAASMTDWSAACLPRSDGLSSSGLAAAPRVGCGVEGVGHARCMATKVGPQGSAQETQK